MEQDHSWIDSHLKYAKRKSAIPQNTIVEVNLKTGTESKNNFVPRYDCEKITFPRGTASFGNHGSSTTLHHRRNRYLLDRCIKI